MPDGFVASYSKEFVVKIMDEHCVVTLKILHRSSHSRITLAESQIISRIRFGGFTFGPIPPATVLQVNHIHMMTVHHRSIRL